MSPGAERLVGQLIVLIPTLVASYFLGRMGMALFPRLAASIGVGMLMIMAWSLWQRSRRQ